MRLAGAVGPSRDCRLEAKEKDGDGCLDSEAGHSRASTLLNDIVIVLFVIDLTILVTPWI